MSTIYDFLKPEEIAAINVLEKNGFKVVANSKVIAGRELKSGKRIARNFYSSNHDLVVCLKSLKNREQPQSLDEAGIAGAKAGAQARAQAQATPEAQISGDTALDDMSRADLISEAKKIDGIGNPATMKTEVLKELIAKNKQAP
jgi:hypothetical protein